MFLLFLLIEGMGMFMKLLYFLRVECCCGEFWIFIVVILLCGGKVFFVKCGVKVIDRLLNKLFSFIFIFLNVFK